MDTVSLEEVYNHRSTRGETQANIEYFAPAQLPAVENWIRLSLLKRRKRISFWGAD